VELQIQKGLYYSLVISRNFVTEGDTGTSTPSPTPNDETQKYSSENVEPSLSPPDQSDKFLSGAVATRCMRLMNHLIDHFTPILFTPATTPHMACTDVFADKWMTLVIQPSLDCDGVYKPLETLQKMAEIDWAKEGLCIACVEEKKAEWKLEQERVWKNMDKWLGLPGNC